MHTRILSDESLIREAGRWTSLNDSINTNPAKKDDEALLKLRRGLSEILEVSGKVFEILITVLFGSASDETWMGVKLVK